MFDEISKLKNGAPVRKSKSKRYVHRDLEYEKTADSAEGAAGISVTRRTVIGCEELSDIACVAIREVRERLPVSSFPSSADMDSVRFVKTSSVQLAPHVHVVFEGACGSHGSQLTYSVNVRATLDKKDSSCEGHAISVARQFATHLARIRDAKQIEDRHEEAATTEIGSQRPNV